MTCDQLDIRGFIETSFLDWDGKVCSVVCLPHCNFRCPFCHNSGLVQNPEQYENIPAGKIEKYLLGHKDFIDGVCISGGEPSLHKELFSFMRRIKNLDFNVKLDTNGYDPECVQRAIDEKMAGYIAMDVKGPIDERYDKLSGIKIDLNKIKKSIKIITESNIPYEFRTTVIPTLLDKRGIEDIAQFIKGARKFVLQQFVPKDTLSPSFINIKPYTKEELLDMTETAKRFVANVVIRGA